jgi:hypothetical protein
MDLHLLYRDFGAAAFTLAPTSPERLLALLGAAHPQPIANPLPELHDHKEHAWSLQQSGSSDEAPLIICHSASPTWSLALEVDGMTGWTGCAPNALHTLSAAVGAVYSAYFDQEDARVLTAADGGDLGGIDAISGRRWGPLTSYAAQRLDAAGFHDAGISSELSDAIYIDRLDAAFTAITGHSLDACLAGPGWIGAATG